MQKIAIIFIIAIIFTIFAKLSQLLVPPGTLVIPVWPPSGISLAAVLIFGDIALTGIFIGGFVSNAHMFTTEGITLLAMLYALIPGVGAVLQAYVGKLTLIGFSGTDDLFKNTRSVLIFILISAFVTCMIGATIGASTLVLTGKIPLTQFPADWVTWWISDAVGVVAITPTIIAWYQKWQEQIPLSQILNLVITWLFILLIGYMALHAHVQIAYLFIPFAIWAAFQFDIKLSLLTGLLISSLCIYGVTLGYGVIQNTLDYTAILMIQIFISIIFLTILLIDAILTDREKAYNNLQLLNTQLEKRVLDRTKDLSKTNEQLEFQKNKAIEAFEALKQSHARLMQSEKMASLGLLTAGVAHEIKNPLNAMSANMESIKMNMDHIVQSLDQTHADEKIKKEVNGISEKTGSLIAATNEGIKRTAGIIADLTAFARADEAEMLMTDIHQNIDSTLNLLSSEIKSNITVVKEYGDVPPILCHPGKINQVIMNILINAIHALQSRPDSKIIIKTQIKDGSIILSIKDNGAGIKKEVLDKIFVPFFTTKHDGLGSGLGLFISNNIIKEHNGTISVTSELEKGTEFIITLPIKGM